MNRLFRDSGTALIWFIALTVITALLALVLVSALDQFLFAKALKDFTEQFAIASKSYSLIEPDQNLQIISSKLWAELENTRYWLDSISLESGKTIKVEVCGYWQSPIELVSSTRKICEVALAR